MNVFAGGKIHHGVGAPFRRPTHFLDFFLDRGSHGAVADVRVDFYQEIAADDHRLGFGMIDVCGNDGAAAGDFGPHEFGCDLVGDVRTERVAAMLMREIVAGVPNLDVDVEQFGERRTGAVRRRR